MSFSIHRPGICRNLLILSYSSKPSATKRSTSSGIIPPPKLNCEDLTHPNQAANARDRNANVPERTFVALSRDLDAWRMTTKGADELRARQSQVGEFARTAVSSEENESADRKARAIRDSVHAHERELARLERSLLASGLRIPNTSHPSVPLGPESDARVLSTHGPKPIPADPKRDRNLLNGLSGMKFFDRDAGVISSGAGFAYVRGGGALLLLRAGDRSEKRVSSL